MNKIKQALHREYLKFRFNPFRYVGWMCFLGIGVLGLLFTIRVIPVYLNLLTEVLRRAIDSGMSDTFQLVFVIATLGLIVKIASFYFTIAMESAKK